MKTNEVLTGLAVAAFAYAAWAAFKKQGGALPSVFAAVPGGRVAPYARGSYDAELRFSHANIEGGIDVPKYGWPVYVPTAEQNQADAGGGFQ